MLNKIIENNEIADSLKATIVKRLTSPIYGVFLVSWAIFNWEFLGTLFFVSEDKIWLATGLLKNEYLKNKFFNPLSLEVWFFHILPIIITWLVIWVFPKWVAIPAFKQEEKNKTEKRKIQIQEQKKLEIAKQELEKEGVKRLEITTKKIDKEKEIALKDPSINWENEYNIFRKSNFFDLFHYIIKSVYEYRGDIEPNYGNFKMPSNILSYAHVNGLVNLNKDGDKIELTEKGKFFIKKFQERNLG